jgi:aminopeptidase N
VTENRSSDRLTRLEAEARASVLGDVAYVLDLDLEAGAKTFRGDVTITFRHRGGGTFLEWLGGTIERFEVNGAVLEPDWDGYRIALPAAVLEPENRVQIAYQRPYDHTGEGFHQFVDPADGAEYLYTQFEPYAAHRLFPCFDQPDIKATYEVSVTAPESWLVTTAAREAAREAVSGGRSRRVFERTAPFSTYLFSVVAGEYRSVYDEHRGIDLGLHARASLMQHLDSEELFDLTKQGMDYFGELFAEPYPFGKYDQVFVPEFNWGGMENVGNVTYTDSVVFRDPPTEDQLMRRAEYFLHELAHMWFGDLVTLRWWNDLWLNESFASYVAYKALDARGDKPTTWQDFNFRMKLQAYREDQRPTTHPIADEVPSTDETFLNFDGITYGKGAAVLRQLVYAIGEDAFRAGLRIYFERHRFGNATVEDFLSALEVGSGMDLLGWSAVWLKTPSLNTLSVAWDADGGAITAMHLEQSAPDEHPYIRPHATAVGLVDEDGIMRVIPARIDERSASVPEAEGLPVPAFVYPNAGDHAYAKTPLDPASVGFARRGLGTIDDPLLRQQVWASLWEMVRDRQLSSLDYLDLVADHLPGEGSLPIVQMVTATVGGAIGRYVPEPRIDDAASRFVAVADAAIGSAPPGDRRVLWARALIGAAFSEADARRAAEIVDAPPEGLSVDQDMRWAVAVRWASLGVPGADERVAAERDRDPSDRGDRAVVAAESARPDREAKEEVWTRLHGDGYASLHMAKAAAAAFWQRPQAALLEPYVEPFFAGLPAVFAEREPEAARAYFGSFFPHHLVDEETRARIAGLLAGDGMHPMLRRLLVEADDDIDRAIACRAVAESGEQRGASSE